MEENEEKIMVIKDDENTEFIFKMYIEDSYLHFWLKENKVYAPFTFEETFTMQEIIEHHKAFRACDNLEEVYKHLINLYEADKNRVAIYVLGPQKERSIIFRIDYISEAGVDTKDFTVKLKMTEEKDKDLLELYGIQKRQIERLKKIKRIIDKKSPEYPLCKAINKILAECQSDITGTN